MEETGEIFVYKVKYDTKQQAIEDFLAKGIIDEDQHYINGTQAVVYFEEETIFHVDVMTDRVYEFDREFYPDEPGHIFAGWEEVTEEAIRNKTRIRMKKSLPL